jgi:hypothetical protein
LDFCSTFLEQTQFSRLERDEIRSVRHGLTKVNNKKIYNREVGSEDAKLIHLAEDIIRKTAVAHTVMKLCVSQVVGGFLSSCMDLVSLEIRYCEFRKMDVQVSKIYDTIRLVMFYVTSG